MADWRANPVIECRACGAGPMIQWRAPGDGSPRHKGRGLCRRCYNWAQATDSMDRWPQLRRGDPPAGIPLEPLVTPPNLPAAACANHDQPKIFFLTSEVGEAKAVCRPCPERLPCLRWALAHREHGVWGGTTDEERHRIRQRQKVTV